MDMKCCHGESIYSKSRGCMDSRLTKLGFLTDAFKLGAVFVVIFYGRVFWSLDVVCGLFMKMFGGSSTASSNGCQIARHGNKLANFRLREEN